MARRERTEAQLLVVADLICEELHNRVWFKKMPKAMLKKGIRYFEFHYHVFRMGEGLVKKIGQPQELVSFLCGQLPEDKRDAYRVY